jgi:hypothetical protein
MAGDKETNGSNALAGAPVWLRATVLLGAPTLIALGLVYWITIGADTRLMRIDDTVQAVEAFEVTHDDRVRTSFQRLETKQDESLRVLTALCVNAAKDEAARNRCLGR